MPTAYGYIRVSTLEQANHGASLEAQEKAISDYYDNKLTSQGYTFGGCLSDPAVTGKKNFSERTNGLRLTTKVEAGDLVVFSKLDRGFRNSLDALQTVESWDSRGVKAVFLDIPLSEVPGYMAKFYLQVMAAGAEMENGRRNERACEGRTAKFARGEYPVGGPNPPYPYSKVVTLHGRRRVITLKLDDNWRHWGKKALEWFEQGYSYRDIYYHIVKNKVPRFSNANFNPNLVRQLIDKEKKFVAKEAAGMAPHQLLEKYRKAYLDSQKKNGVE